MCNLAKTASYLSAVCVITCYSHLFPFQEHNKHLSQSHQMSHAFAFTFWMRLGIIAKHAIKSEDVELIIASNLSGGH